MLFAHNALGHRLYHNWALDLRLALIPIKPVAMGFTLTKMKELIKTIKNYIFIYLCNNLIVVGSSNQNRVNISTSGALGGI
jgi:hypothetical protein